MSVRLPNELPGTNSGVPLDGLGTLVERWRDDHDWRALEARLNAVPQLMTDIDGQNIHVLHVRSAEPNALPLVLTHGWPGSVREFLDVLGPLTDPVAYRATSAEAFHVVVPALPGYGYSGPLREAGWDVPRIARAWAELMARLGYDRYGAHGSDWGAAVSRALGVVDSAHLVAIHVTTLTDADADAGTADPSQKRERRSVEAGDRYRRELSGYAMIQSTRPQTLAYGLHDSPVGQLAWIADCYDLWTDPSTPVDPDALLDTASLYWFTGTAGSSAQLYRESLATWEQEQPSSTVPTAVASFPHDLTVPIRRLAERNNRIVRWTEFDRGGHFPALEVPELLVDDLRATFAGYR